LSGYTQDKEAIYAAISAASPDNYEKVCEQVSANTENISELSAFTSGLSFTIAEQSQMIEQISAATTGTSEEISDLSGYTQQAVSSLTEDIETLSALTTQTSDDLADLSGFTGQAVSSLTDDLQALSAATETLSAATVETASDLADLSGYTNQFVSGITDDIEALSAATESGFTAISQDLGGKQDALTAGSGITITNNVISTRANVHSETVFEIVSLTEAQYNALVVKDPNTLYIITE
jgi:ABC-type transporter Mla subunit MlaD